MEYENNNVEGTRYLITDRLLFFDSIREDEIVREAMELADAAEHRDGPHAAGAIAASYFNVQRQVLRRVQQGDPGRTFWQNYILELVADSENGFSLHAENGSLTETEKMLAEEDLRILRRVLKIDWKDIASLIGNSRSCVCRLCPEESDERMQALASALMEGSLQQGAASLAAFYAKYGCGAPGRYRAFVWDGSLRGIEQPDPIRFDDLIGYELQQEQLIRNTEAFVQGRRANNVLLYGDKGTGKSSSVKALLNRYGEEGLRLVSIPKDRIFDITDVMEMLSDRGGRFILFIDDLSFEETEAEYKRFKSVLEGGVETQPENVLVYATSNRRNLVKEMWSDRGDNGEVHASDGMQERLSLADRFGLTITFQAPDKKLYEEMVRTIAGREGIQVGEETLLQEARQWDMRQTGRSGRSARQFVTHMAAKESK